MYRPQHYPYEGSLPDWPPRLSTSIAILCWFEGTLVRAGNPRACEYFEALCPQKSRGKFEGEFGVGVEWP